MAELEYAHAGGNEAHSSTLPRAHIVHAAAVSTEGLGNAFAGGRWTGGSP